MYVKLWIKNKKRLKLEVTHIFMTMTILKRLNMVYYGQAINCL